MQITLAVAGDWRTFTTDDVLAPYIYVFYAAFLVSFAFTPIMRIVAQYYGIVDQPDSARKIHTAPVAYLGGVAVFLGWICGLAISQLTGMHDSLAGLTHVQIPFALVLGAFVTVTLGLWDDVRKISPRTKILGQLLAATFLLSQGIGNHAIDAIIGPLNHRLYYHLGFSIPHWISVVLGAGFVYFVVVGCCNATNLMDGLDGLCGGVTAVIAGGFLFLAITIARFSGGYHPNDDALRIVLGLALLGAVLGFVPYNFNPASIFMGDAGSMLLGFASATMILLSAQGTHSKWFLASMVMFALPVLDTALAFARRFVKGRPIFSADQNHFHHQMVARGFSVKQTVMISYGLAIFFALCGGMITYMRTRYAMCFYLVIFGSISVAAYKLGMVHEQVKEKLPAKPTESIANSPAPEPVGSGSI